VIVQNPLTGLPVVIAPGRAQRPGATAQPTAPPQCPLCEGHEAMTPPEVMAIGRPADGAPDTPGWNLRVVPNKYPAIPGQEVIVHAPTHTTRFTSLEPAAAQRIDAAWRARIDAALAGGAAWALVGINEGRAAGASLEHSHSQLVPFADVPPLPAAAAPHLRAQGCALCAALESERSRVVWEDGALVAFCPAWAQFAREVWIAPTRHEPRTPAAAGLAACVAQIVRRLEGAVAPDIAWNMVLYEAPAGVADHHWHAQVMPRTAVAAAVELGAGVWVDSVDPNVAAAELRVV
jgi:UDPglucose--hexose-1-phosphate uridylyltransferase